MRTKIEQAIMVMNFNRVWKNYLVVSLFAVLVTLGAALFLLMPQLREGAALLMQGAGPLEWRLDVLEDAFEWSLAGYASTGMTAASLFARTMTVVAVCVLGLVFVGYWVLTALWLYKEAAASDMGGALWGLLALAANILAVALFFALRSVLRQKCVGCGQWMLKQDDYCAHCGTHAKENCASCGHPLGAGNRYCTVCGASVGVPSAEVHAENV